MEVDGREVSLTSAGRGSPPKLIDHMRGESLKKLEKPMVQIPTVFDLVLSHPNFLAFL